MEERHDAALGHYVVAVIPGLKGFNQDDFAAAMECKHDVVVSRAGADREPANVVTFKVY